MNSNHETGLDISILQDGAISLYHDIKILDNDLDWFKKSDYKIYDFDTSHWTKETAHKGLKNQLEFPDYYGENLDAFNDCLGDKLSYEVEKMVLIFRHFEKLSKIEKEFCQGLLDVIAHQSRLGLLNGQKLIGLVQSNDPNIHYNKIGGYHPTWNRAEWLDETRRKK